MTIRESGLHVPFEEHARREMPSDRKNEGGSYFDDELETQEAKAREFGLQVQELLMHLNARPDHVVYVGSADERGKMRTVFNSWKMQGALLHNPNIRIDYGVPDGTLRVGE
jgi:hypothetical protein